MTKTFGGSKLRTNPTQILKRVLSKSSKTTSIIEEEKRNRPMEGQKEPPRQSSKPSLNVEAELEMLKKQIGSLQTAVDSMQNETIKKEVTIENLSKEKELLAADLKKQQRTNSTLKQQLEDEREFYYKEKEVYCQEMNDCKKLKKTLKVGDYKTQIEHYKKEIAKLKDTLTQTLEANYNLSIKFLRMKNTKYCIKNRLKKLETLHEHTISELRIQMEQLKTELGNIVDQKLLIPIPPSNKKYLQIVKQNSTLAHENLCLRLELDKLNLEMDKHRMLEIQLETNSKLKYINHKTRSETQIEKDTSGEHSKLPGHDRKQSKSEQKLRSKNTDRNTETLDLYQFEEKPRTAKIKSVKNDFEIAENMKISTEERPCKEKDDTNGDGSMNIDLLRLDFIEKKFSETFTQSSDCTNDTYDAVRTQSAPEIVQSSLFLKNK
ncbi:uncharacterized protein [Onthophagus taurus]|uniref:uncharacterized protein n=1 Tax=Onthophagus taurus TaxID=166361 RepID=UPI000C20FA7B|nr:MAR-binding filament-like protein 1 [Onthophagus taurus]